MERLTWVRNLDGFDDIGLRLGVTIGDAVCRLAEYEDIGTTEEFRLCQGQRNKKQSE